MKEWWEKRQRRKNLKKFIEEYHNQNVPSMAKEILYGISQLLLLLVIFGLLAVTALSILLIVLGYIYTL